MSRYATDRIQIGGHCSWLSHTRSQFPILWSLTATPRACPPTRFPSSAPPFLPIPSPPHPYHPSLKLFSTHRLFFFRTRGSFSPPQPMSTPSSQPLPPASDPPLPFPPPSDAGNTRPRRRYTLSAMKDLRDLPHSRAMPHGANPKVMARLAPNDPLKDTSRRNDRNDRNDRGASLQPSVPWIQDRERERDQTAGPSTSVWGMNGSGRGGGGRARGRSRRARQSRLPLRHRWAW